MPKAPCKQSRKLHFVFEQFLDKEKALRSLQRVDGSLSLMYPVTGSCGVVEQTVLYD